VMAFEPAFVYRLGWRAREDGYNEIRGGQGTPEEGEDTVKAPRRMRISVGKITVGPTVSWIDPEPAVGSPLSASGALGANGFSLAGVKAALQVDRTDDDAMPTSGFTVRAAAAGYPAVLGLDGAFGTLSASTTGYIPIMSGGPHFAVRLGGAVGTGDVPFQFAPSIGGRSSLRGFSSRRFTGDASANAGVEFRVPVGEVNFMLRSKLGLFALADAGRVWLDGSSPGGIHTGVGGGFWLASLGRSVSVAYAQGEAGKFYVRLGQSY
jgi:outer membrane protein assembly factor BamA